LPGLRKVFTELRKVFRELRKLFTGLRKVFTGFRKVFAGFRKVFAGTPTGLAGTPLPPGTAGAVREYGAGTSCRKPGTVGDLLRQFRDSGAEDGALRGCPPLRGSVKPSGGGAPGLHERFDRSAGLECRASRNEAERSFRRASPS